MAEPPILDALATVAAVGFVLAVVAGVIGP
jgi:hypothetical protein